jgi:hypothetical protein
MIKSTRKRKKEARSGKLSIAVHWNSISIIANSQDSMYVPPVLQRTDSL